MTDRKAKKLAQVRALLAKAESTTPEEAQMCRQKANDLMIAYAIEEYEIAQANNPSARTVMRRDYDFQFYFRSKFSEELWQIMWAAAKAARVRLVAAKVFVGGDSSSWLIPIIGTDPDLDYFDMLFTSLMMQMVRDLDPNYNIHDSLEHNLYRMRSAGKGWPQIASELYKQGIIDIPPTHVAKFHYVDRPDWKLLNKSTQQLMRSTLAKRYRDYTHGNNLEQNYTNPEVYQRSYAAGFTSAVTARLYAMARPATSSTTDDGNKYALVVRSTEQQIKELMMELWPDLFNSQPRAASNSKLPKLREKKIDRDSLSKGHEAGRRADITSKGERLKATKALPQ